MKTALISIAVLAAVATLGDWIWAAFLPRHLMVAGIVHGALLCLAMGAVLARPAARAAAGAVWGLGVGAAAAASFYVLAPLIRSAAMFAAWFVLWVLLALLQRHLGARPASWGVAAARGAFAGAASGLAFYLVSGMWTRWNPSEIDYLDHLLRWAFAFAPGFIILQAPFGKRRV